MCMVCVCAFCILSSTGSAASPVEPWLMKSSLGHSTWSFNLQGSILSGAQTNQLHWKWSSKLRYVSTCGPYNPTTPLRYQSLWLMILQAGASSKGKSASTQRPLLVLGSSPPWHSLRFFSLIFPFGSESTPAQWLIRWEEPNRFPYQMEMICLTTLQVEPYVHIRLIWKSGSFPFGENFLLHSTTWSKVTDSTGPSVHSKVPLNAWA